MTRRKAENGENLPLKLTGMSPDEQRRLAGLLKSKDREADAIPKSIVPKVGPLPPGYLGAKDLAQLVGVEPYEFRTFLRTKEGGHHDKEYTRYAWKADNKTEIANTLKEFKKWKDRQDRKKSDRAAERERQKLLKELQRGDQGKQAAQG